MSLNPVQKQPKDVDCSVHVPVPQYTSTCCVETQSHTVAVGSAISATSLCRQTSQGWHLELHLTRVSQACITHCSTVPWPSICIHICKHMLQQSPVLDTGIQYCAGYEVCEVSTGRCYLKEGEACHPWLSCKHNKACLCGTRPYHTPDSTAQASSAVTL